MLTHDKKKRVELAIEKCLQFYSMADDCECTKAICEFNACICVRNQCDVINPQEIRANAIAIRPLRSMYVRVNFRIFYLSMRNK